MKKPLPLKLDERLFVNYCIAEGCVGLLSAKHKLARMATEPSNDTRGDVLMTELEDILIQLRKIAFSEHPILPLIHRLIDDELSTDEF